MDQLPLINFEELKKNENQKKILIIVIMFKVY